jgi:hypothetical protein
MRAAALRSFDVGCKQSRAAFAAIVKATGGPLLALDVGSKHVGIALSDTGFAFLIAFYHSHLSTYLVHLTNGKIHSPTTAACLSTGIFSHCQSNGAPPVRVAHYHTFHA